jgi:hypothetical protein
MTPHDARRPALPLVLGTALLAAAAGTAAAQDEDIPYPHGDFSDDCERCHRPEGWTPVRISEEFDHAAYGFPLLGAHAAAECRACHETPEFSRAEPACVSCHLDVHRAELGGDCGLCHTPRSFIDRSAMVRAHSTTRFPLRGTHRVTDCEDCHAPASGGSLRYVHTPVDCAACHLDDYRAATDPDHQASGFPQTCESCHRAVAWVPAGFDHTLASGTACVSCHLDDYEATVEPDHAAAAFPQDCELCHSTRRFVPASFDGLDHDGRWFPIYSGKHRGKWSRCSDCHVVSTDFSQFSCLDCHAHDDPGRMADKHSGVSGYVFDSQACLSCHPRGDE